MMGVDEDSPKALHDRDLELAFPDGSDLSEVPLADFYRFCRTIGVVDNGKGFCGNLFSDRERVYRTARYTEIDGKKWTVGGDGSATDVEYAPPDGAKVSTKDLGDGVFEDAWQDGTVPFTTPCVEALEERAMSSIGNAGILSKGRICTMTILSECCRLSPCLVSPKTKRPKTASICGVYHIRSTQVNMD